MHQYDVDMAIKARVQAAVSQEYWMREGMRR